MQTCFPFNSGITAIFDEKIKNNNTTSYFVDGMNILRLYYFYKQMISKKTKYGLKALSYIVDQKTKRPISVLEISKEHNISQKFLEAILSELKKAGFLGAKKGKGGGYYLLKPADEIPIASVFRTLEGPIAWLPCVSLNYYETCDDCANEEKCNLNKLMLEVRDSILNIVENKTLADL